ncbi:Rne/Rng family ribonuclease [Sandaracinobacteroides hominis]|uniref:Rne/Rng family ribonuclease n=1 Tax=Sandaracinobacteroides hominis TaxID=2780086 RepID=UPI0018F4A649|nr:Rne/Rng family ribonuclease [Sandaracinobacteroides hominis]
MTTRMLIDARHQEETRVAVVKGNRIEEFDFEAAARKQIKGNIYLAKVTRVEPSLQAAFIDYGGNRHGFLAFSEIHPDYYQIPKEDRDALLREEQRLVEEHAAGDDHDDDHAHDDHAPDDHAHEQEEPGDAGEPAEGEPRHRPEEHGNSEEAGAEALRRRRMALRRRYKIQDVIRRRQVMLVQVVKEERGNKGAALTTYISLAGRYSVLMPNTAQGGGISRKIANAADRKRLKSIMTDLNLPSTMGAIVRTAGLERTKTEIKRDFDYLTRLWDEIREKTLTSSAPALIHEDSDLVKRAIRDIYSREIDEILVDGPEGYAHAKTFMKLLMPSHAKKVLPYNDPVPLFHRAGVESQLAALLNPVVNLRSGGYIVINPTEALVAIDVNSGRSTREYNIEETALKTNIEAAEEVARQLRLRDLAGLVVVDFIDMESNSNNRKVERALKEALKHDRARIQVGRISTFGLLEMSRQRLRTGVLEASTEVCPMCDGLGLVRTPGSAALAALRLLEEEAVRGRASMFRLRADSAVAVYMLNRKRAEITEIEDRYGVIIEVVPDDSLIGGRVAIDSSGPPPAQAPRLQALAAPRHVHVDDAQDDIEDEVEEEDEEQEDRGDREEAEDREERGGRNGDRRRRRRRGGRGRDGGRESGHENGRDRPQAEPREAVEQDGELPEGAEAVEAGEEADGDGREPRRRRRRRRRGGRRETGEALNAAAEAAEDEAGDAPAEVVPEPAMEAVADEAPAAEAAKPKRTRKAAPKKAAAEAIVEAIAEVPAEAAAEPATGEAPAAEKPKRASKAAPKKAAPKRAAKAQSEAATETASEAVPEPVAAPAPEPAAEEMPKRPRKAAPKKAAAQDVAAEPMVTAEADADATGDEGEGGAPRRGWWQRTFGN